MKEVLRYGSPFDLRYFRILPRVIVAVDAQDRVRLSSGISLNENAQWFESVVCSLGADETITISCAENVLERVSRCKTACSHYPTIIHLLSRHIRADPTLRV